MCQISLVQDKKEVGTIALDVGDIAWFLPAIQHYRQRIGCTVPRRRHKIAIFIKACLLNISEQKTKRKLFVGNIVLYGTVKNRIGIHELRFISYRIWKRGYAPVGGNDLVIACLRIYAIKFIGLNNINRLPNYIGISIRRGGKAWKFQQFILIMGKYNSSRPAEIFIPDVGSRQCCIKPFVLDGCRQVFIDGIKTGNYRKRGTC